MCGIIGYIGKINQKTFKKATNSLKHRGPDDIGFYFDKKNQISLGHTRLSIIDLSKNAKQPMKTNDNNLVLIFNGEIYNFIELKKKLILLGHSFKSNSDSEVLLYLYKEYGVSMLKKLNGIFAFAIWDKQKKEVFIARDHFGIKPLYFLENKNFFIFASEIKAIHSTTREIGSIDHHALNKFLSYLWCPGERTSNSSIKKLGPGEYFFIKNKKIIKHNQWYKLPVFRNLKNINNQSIIIEEIKRKIRKAVHRQMLSDVPVGAFLSGGLDSSSIVAFAKEINPNIKCFSIEIEGGEEKGVVDDLPYAKKVAKYLNVDMEIIRVSSDQISTNLNKLIEMIEEPVADPAILHVYNISNLAQRNGIKVLLSGVGGDDIFSGYRRHQSLLLEKYYDFLPDKIKKSITYFSNYFDQRIPVLRKSKKFLNNANLKSDQKLVNYFLWSNREDLLRLYSDDFKNLLQGEKTEEPMIDFLAKIPKNIHPLEKMLALEQRFFLSDHNLNYTDKMSMAVGVEVRVPFLDKELVEFAKRIPFNLKLKNNSAKWIFKKSMEPYLPKDVIYRPKKGFGAPLRNWIKNELKEKMEDLLSIENLGSRGIFNPKSIENLIYDNNRGKVDASYTLFSLMCIEIWCKKFIDK